MDSKSQVIEGISRLICSAKQQQTILKGEPSTIRPDLEPLAPSSSLPPRNNQTIHLLSRVWYLVVVLQFQTSVLVFWTPS